MDRHEFVDADQSPASMWVTPDGRILGCSIPFGIDARVAWVERDERGAWRLMDPEPQPDTIAVTVRHEG